MLGVAIFTTIHFEALAQEPYLIDAHSQIDPSVDPEAVVASLERGGIRRAILSTIYNVAQEKVLDLALRCPGRIIPAVRTKGYMSAMPTQRYRQELGEQVKNPAYGAMAEVLLYHAAKHMVWPGGSRDVPEIVVEPDDPRVQLALGWALRKRWPFIAHIEFATIGPKREAFMTKFKALLVKYPDHPFVLIHKGQLGLADVRQLIDAHPNIYFIVTPRSTGLVGRERQRIPRMFEDGRILPEWSELLAQHPDRFILGFDNIEAFQWGEPYLRQIRLWREALTDVPENVTQALAHGNAERLWHLAPLD
jgi:hypothetical protein